MTAKNYRPPNHCWAAICDVSCNVSCDVSCNVNLFELGRVRLDGTPVRLK